MSIQAALEFLQAIRRSPDLQAALAGVGDHEQLARAALEAGFACRADEITQAFGLECSFRQAAHLQPTPSSGSGEMKDGPRC